MKYLLRGHINTTCCGEIKYPLEKAIIRLYRVKDKQPLTHAIAAEPKETFAILDEKAIKAKKSLLLAETRTDENGMYEFVIDSKKNDYAGEPVQIDVFFPEVPDFGQPEHKNKDFKPFQVSITTIQPRWRQTDEALIAGWNYTFSPRLWCHILRLLDIWVICGKVTICDTKIPVPGIEVIAMDNDWITDDLLGKAVTNSNGHFHIYYTSKEFKKTFLSPIINVETPFPLNSGPDVYFKFALSGSVFHEENPARGKQPDRENVGNCLCVNLCVPEGTYVPPRDEETIAGFFKIGFNRQYHIVGNISPATGKTTGKPAASWNDLAFYSNIALIGTLTKKLNGQPLEYLFQYREYDAPGGAAISGWTEIAPGQIANSVIGYTQQIVADPENPVLITEYAIHPNVDQQPVSLNGNWIEVPQLANFITNSNGLLIRLKTDTLASGTVNMAGLVPGQSTTTVHPLVKNRYFRIRMIKREKGNLGSAVVAGTSNAIAIFNTVYQNIPQKGSWLPGTSNELGVAAMDIAQLTSGSGCAKITNQLDIRYTAANPNLGNVSIGMTGPGGPHSFDPVVFTTPGEEAHGTSSYTGNAAALPQCAYIVRVSAELNLTNGEAQHNGIWDEVAFCK